IVLRAKTISGLSRYAINLTNNSIAIRIPDEYCTRQLIQMTSSKLLVGTSANFSQGPSSKRFIDLNPKLVTECDAVLSKNTFSESKGESTIVDISNEAHPQIIRTGALPKNKIIEAINHNL